jgi:ABC-2 type transport system ATP-binding protein
MSETAVIVRDLRKTYATTVALDGMEFSVRCGEVFGLIGPNGAGKTTTIDCIAGMRRADSGELKVLGMDPWAESTALHSRIGLQQQESELPERMKVRESLQLFGHFFGIETPVFDLLEKVGLEAKSESCFSDLSGGQKRRLFVALALVHDPELVMLDELTSGLDPRGRRNLWSLVEEIRGSGRTVILSSHYMDEAEKLCDRVAIIDRGKVAALDTPEALVRRYCPGLRLRLGCSPDFNSADALDLDGVLSVTVSENECMMDLEDAGYVVPIIKSLSDAGESLGDLHTEKPSLEDVFMVLTGREYVGEGK